MSIFDLASADTMQERSIAGRVRAGNTNAVEIAGKNPSSDQIINELMRLSNLNIQIGIEEGQQIVVRKNGGNDYKSRSRLVDIARGKGAAICFADFSGRLGRPARPVPTSSEFSI
jgi:hypothetical protein